MAYNKDTLRVKILKKSQLIDSGCIEWTGYRSPTGYARIRLDGKQKAVHRIVFEAPQSHTDRTRLARVLRHRGLAISGDISKIYRRAA